jgi:hypothetical protein
MGKKNEAMEQIEKALKMLPENADFMATKAKITK